MEAFGRNTSYRLNNDARTYTKLSKEHIFITLGLATECSTLDDSTIQAMDKRMTVTMFQLRLMLVSSTCMLSTITANKAMQAGSM